MVSFAHAQYDIDATGINVVSDDRLEFYHRWLAFMRPLHRMNTSDMEVMSHMLVRREELRRSGMWDDEAERELLSTDGRQLLIARIGCGGSSFRQSLTRMRRRGALSGCRIEPRLIPHFKRDNGEYLLMVHFTIKGDEKRP